MHIKYIKHMGALAINFNNKLTLCIYPEKSPWVAEIRFVYENARKAQNIYHWYATGKPINDPNSLDTIVNLGILSRDDLCTLQTFIIIDSDLCIEFIKDKFKYELWQEKNTVFQSHKGIDFKDYSMNHDWSNY